MPQKTMPRLDFKAINEALLARAEHWMCSWLPAGKKNGHEWQVGSLDGDSGKSLSINLVKGVWSDFASGETGADLISLYAAIHSLKPIDAARELAAQTGVQNFTENTATPQATPAVASSDGHEDELVCPVPAGAPRPHRAHIKRGVPQAVWTYYAGDAVLGYVYRFQTSDGGKETIPHTLWRNPKTGVESWHWRGWPPQRRPVYRPSQKSLIGERTVIVVEGEKCAFNLDTFLFENGCMDYDVVSWAGGASGTSKVDWQPLAGRTCILWPDADAHKNKAGDAYLEATQQPGQKAMDKIAQALQGLACSVSMIPLPAVGAMPDGWDCADAIDQGWGLAAMLDYLATAKTVSREAGLAQVTKLEFGYALGLPTEQDWSHFLQRSKEGNIKPTRENVAQAIKHDPAFAGAVKYNLFSNRVDVIKDLPWRKRAMGDAKLSEWSDFDSLHLGDYLCKTHFYPSVGSLTLHEAVGLAASSNSYHPVRDGLERLKWDGVLRLDDWLLKCVIDEVAELSAAKREYISLVGRYFVMGAVARIMRPGCKFDYCFVLKGEQGAGKSTLFSVLGGEYFSDAQLKLDDDMSVGMAIAGRWFVEMPEMAAFNRSEINSVKACISKNVDRYRAPYGKTVVDHPRQSVFCGSTNDDTPLRDPTGARRFWVVDVTRVHINNEYLRSIRFQLFAEALEAFNRGEAYHPTYEQENALFKPEQERHTRLSPVYEQLLHLAGNEVGDWLQKTEWTTAEIGMKLTGKGVDSVTPTLQQEIGAAMRRMGWTVKQKRLAGKTIRVYLKPANWGAGASPTSTNSINGDDDDMPF